jgi:hypothetical protein
LSGIVAGFGSTTGARLNTVIHAVSLFALMVLTRRLTGNIWAPIAAAALWTFTSVAFDTTFFARQYELLGCFGILTVLAVHGTLTAEKRPQLPAAGVSCALAGMTLTHWLGLVGSLYVLVVVMALAVIARRGHAPLRAATRLPLLASAWAGGQVLALFGHPRILSHLRASSQAQRHPPADDLQQRLRQTAQTLGGFFGFSHADHGNAARFVLLALFVAVAVVPAWQWARALRVRQPAELERVLPDALVALAIPSFAAVVTVPFLVGLGPSHSMSARYLSLLWPMWALGLSWAACGAMSFATPAIPRFALVSLGTVALFVWSFEHRKAAAKECVALCGGDTNVSKTLPLVRAVITDNTHRGTFGQVIPFIRDDAQVFAFPTLPGAVPERPEPPPVDVRELVRGLRLESAVSIFHHPSEIPAHASEDILRALDAARLTIALMSEWPFALPGVVVLITFNSSKPGQGPNDALQQLARRGSGLTGFDDVEGYAAVLLGGKVEKEVISRSGEATLTAEDASVPLKDFRIISGPGRSTIILGQREYDNRHAGFEVLVYDPRQHTVVYRTEYPAGHTRPRAWSDLAARMP